MADETVANHEPGDVVSPEMVIEVMASLSEYRSSAAPALAEELAAGNTVAFNLAVGRHTEFGCFVTPTPKVLGPYFHDGNPAGRHFVGLCGKGCYHFRLGDAHWSYVQEKLDLSEEEAKAAAQMMRELGEALGEPLAEMRDD